MGTAAERLAAEQARSKLDPPSEGGRQRLHRQLAAGLDAPAYHTIYHVMPLASALHYLGAAALEGQYQKMRERIRAAMK